MQEVLKPLYEKVEKVLKGEEIPGVNTGIPEAFVEVSKEFIGYNCFGKVIRNALLHQLANKIQLLREQGIIKPEEICIQYGSPECDTDVALEISQILFPAVFYTSYSKRQGYVQVIDEMYAFLPCTDWVIDGIFEILGSSFIEEYNKVAPINTQTTEEVFETIIRYVGTPF